MPRKPSVSTDQIHVRLRELIAEDGRPIAAIAQEAGLNRQAVYQILDGYRPNPTAQTLARLLAAMGKRWRDLD